MARKQRQHWHNQPTPAKFLPCAAALLVAFAALLSLAAAQDIRGLEVCTAEKQMERRTGCLQTNIELLQQMLTRLTRETQDKMAAAGRDLAAARAATDSGAAKSGCVQALSSPVAERLLPPVAERRRRGTVPGCPIRRVFRGRSRGAGIPDSKFARTSATPAPRTAE